MDKFQQLGAFGVVAVIGFSIGTILYRWMMDRPTDVVSALIIGVFSGFFTLLLALFMRPFRQCIIRN